MESQCVEKNAERVGELEACLSRLTTSATDMCSALAQHYSCTKELAEAEFFGERGVSDLLACLQGLREEGNGLKRQLRRHREVAIAELTASIGVVEDEVQFLRKQIAVTDKDISAADIELSAARQKLSCIMIAEQRTSEIPASAAGSAGISRQATQALVGDAKLFAALTTLPSPSEVETFLSTMAASCTRFSTRRELRALL